MKRAPSVAIFCASALASSTAHAQSTRDCIPGTQICVERGPGGTVKIEPPPVQAGGGVQGGAGSSAGSGSWSTGVNPNVEVKLRTDAWRAYWAWQARLRAEARGRVRVEVEARLRAEARATPDPYALRPAPLGYGVGRMRWPWFEVGPLGACAAFFTGPERPVHGGYCAFLRVRVSKLLGLAVDPSFVSTKHDAFAFGALGLHPGVTLTFARGRGSMRASHAYALAGLDAWIPTDHGPRTPDWMPGGHVGVGALAMSGHAGGVAELRGLARVGAGDARGEPNATIAAARVGVEGRVGLVFGF